MYYEAFFIGVKEGLKLSFCLFLVLQYIMKQDRSFLRLPLFAGVFFVLGCSFFFLRFPVDPWIKETIVRMTGYVFGLFYIGSLIALYHETGDDMFGPLRKLASVRTPLFIVVIVTAVMYFSPDMIGSSLYLQDLSTMGGSFLFIWVAAFGFIMALALSWRGMKHVRVDVIGRLRFSQVLLLLALVKLVSGGIKGFTELSLIPSVQNGLIKLTHDVLHHTLVTVMVPDHQILSVTTWNFLGFIFSQEVALWLSLLLLSAPLILFLIRQFRETIHAPDHVTTGALRRKHIRAVMDTRMVRALPIFVFVMIIIGTWFAEKGDSTTGLYNPEPAPVVAENGKIVLPISSPGTDLLDGMIHKYALTLNGEGVRIMIIKKPGGPLAVALDACEICPPDGYAQGREHVVCLYCNTPIAIDTLGKPGGCNPIPLDAVIDGRKVIIDTGEIEKKWRIVKNTEKHTDKNGRQQ